MRGAVYGPMAEVVHNSLQYLSDQDVQAMAVYLKSLPANEESPEAAATTAAEEVTASVLTRGNQIYKDRCAACHGADGRGKPPAYPPLAQNRSIEMESAVNPIRMVLNGGYPPETAANPRPPFAQVLSDDDIAAVVTFIRVAWGNHGHPASPADVIALRSAPLFD